MCWFLVLARRFLFLFPAFTCYMLLRGVCLTGSSSSAASVGMSDIVVSLSSRLDISAFRFSFFFPLVSFLGFIMPFDRAVCGPGHGLLGSCLAHGFAEGFMPAVWLMGSTDLVEKVGVGQEVGNNMRVLPPLYPAFPFLFFLLSSDTKVTGLVPLLEHQGKSTWFVYMCTCKVLQPYHPDPRTQNPRTKTALPTASRRR